MSLYTPELNLVQGQDDDDTADYLTIGLANSLLILDGLFNQAAGHTHSGSHQGGILGANAFADNTIPGAKLQDNTVYNAKIADATLTAAKMVAAILEGLYANTLHVTSANYSVPQDSNQMYIWCQVAVTITLPSGANRPITVRANNADCTVTATAGSVIGGSPDIASGTTVNGRVAAGDAITFKWDGNNWAAV